MTRQLSHRTEQRKRAARSAFARLRDKRFAVAVLERDLIAAIERDDVSARPDGFPSTAESGPRLVQADEPDDVKLTSVEGAAAALIAGTREDPVARAVRRAEHAVKDAADALERARAALDELAMPPGTQHDVHRCESHGRVGHKIEGELYGTVAGRLDLSCWLCEPCYDFVRKFDRLPTQEEASNHARTGKWRTRQPAARS